MQHGEALSYAFYMRKPSTNVRDGAHRPYQSTQYGFTFPAVASNGNRNAPDPETQRLQLYQHVLSVGSDR